MRGYRIRLFVGASRLMPGQADSSPQLDLSLTLDPLLEVLGHLDRRPEVSLTYLSSGGTVYGRPTLFPTPEGATTNPVSSYGITKLTAEKYVLRHAELHSAPVRILRISNAYGRDQDSMRGQGVIAAALEHCLAEVPLTVYGDGSVSRDFVHVDDVAAAIVGLLGVRGGPDIVNIGCGFSTSLIDVCHLVGEVTGRPLTIEHAPERLFDVPRVQLDTRRLRSLIEFSPRPLIEGVADAWRHLVAQPVLQASKP